MAVAYVDKIIHTYPQSLSGYTGIRIPESSNVLTEFAFVFQKEWMVSKVFQTLWTERFEAGPKPWNNLDCCTTRIPAYDCPSRYGCYCIERPINMNILKGKSTGQPRCLWDPKYVGWATTGGIKNWFFYPNFYPDWPTGIEDDPTEFGQLAGYEIAGDSRPGKIDLMGGQGSSPHSLRIKTFGPPVVPWGQGGYTDHVGHGGAWIYIRNIGVPQRQKVGRYYRLTFWTKAELNSGECFLDCTDDSGNANTMRYQFYTTPEWVKHTHHFQLDKIYDRVAIYSEIPNHTFLIDDIVLEEVEITLAYPSRNILWDFGDGTFGTGLSTSHVYSWPGLYDVKTVLYDQYGQQRINTVVPSLSVYNAYNEQLGLDFSIPNFTNEIPAGETGFDASIPEFRIQRHSSWQSYPNLSGSNYTLFLHASGSLSNKLNVDRYFNEKWSHLDQTWSFYKKILTPAGVVDWEPISSIDTTSDKIYYRWEWYEYFPELDMNFGHGKIVKCSIADPGAAFAGTSGYADFKYIDDLPKNNHDATLGTVIDEPVLLIATIDTENFLSERHPTVYRPRNLNTTGLSLMESQKLTIPVKVVPTPGFGLNITSTGQSQMPVSNIKWEGAPISFFVSTTNNLGYIVETYPPLSGSYGGGAEVNYPGVINVTLRDEAGDILPSEYYHDNLTKLPRAIPSRLNGFVVPLSSGVNKTYNAVTLSARMTIVNPLCGLSGVQVQPDPARGYIMRPSGVDGSVFKVIALRNQNFVTLGGSVEYDYYHTQGYINNAYGTATVIYNYDLTNPLTWTYITDASDANRLVKLDSNGNVLWSADADVLAGHDTLPGDTVGFAGIAIDRNKDVWVTAVDGGFMAKFTTVSAGGTTLWGGDTSATLVTSVSTAQLSSIVSGSSVLSGDVQELGPVGIDTDLDSNIWVTFTHAKSGFIQKFNGTTGMPMSGFHSFEEGETPVDLVVDNHNNVYVITNWWNSTSQYPLCAAVDTDVQAWRGVDASSFPALTSMGMRTGEGITRRFAYKFNSFSVSELSGYGAIRIEGFDQVTIPGGSWDLACDEIFNGWGKIYDIDVDNNTIFVEPHITRQYAGPCPTKYSKDVNTLAANASINYHRGGHVYKFDGESGTKYWEVSGLYDPTHITVDANQNVWVVDQQDHIIQFQSGDGTRVVSKVSGDEKRQLVGFGHTDSNDPNGYIPMGNVIHAPTSYHISGLACDLSNKLNLVNSFDNRMYYVQVDGTDAFAMDINIGKYNSVVIDTSKPDFGNPPYVAFGDFTGFNHYNKYSIRFPELSAVGGSTSFNVYPSGGEYNICKFNEDFDASETIKSYRQQDNLIDSKSFFDNLYGEIVGNDESDPTEIGKTIYEKIANFISNHNDIDTCDVNALYSLCEQYNVPIANFNFPYPPALRRIVNMGSIKHKKLWGERSKFSENFELDYAQGSKVPLNLGEQIPIDEVTSTFILTAGEPIVLRALFSNEYRLITPMVIDNLTTFGTECPTCSSYPLTAYPLSAYSSSWNWNVDPDIADPSDTALANYYDFYKYVPGFENIQKEGVIDWSDDNIGTLSESVSSLSAWSGDNGILENIIDHQLRRGTYNFIDSDKSGQLITQIALDPATIANLTSLYNVSFPASFNAFSINGVKRPAIYLRRGAPVEFVTDSTTTGNPLRIFRHPNKQIETDGVTLTNNAEGTGGKLTYIPPADVPGMMFYGSLNSRNVGYAIVFI